MIKASTAIAAASLVATVLIAVESATLHFVLDIVQRVTRLETTVQIRLSEMSPGASPIRPADFQKERP